MGYLKYVKELWKKPKANMPEMWRERLITWRREPVTVRITHPTRIDRARSLGYKAKQGFVIVRQRIGRGGHMRPKFVGGRRPKHMRRKQVIGKNYQQIAEERVQRKYPNCEVLNSYWVAQDGKFYWYEIILVDRDHPQVLKSPELKWISSPKHKGRVFRGLTSSGDKSRGLRSNKGKGAEKIRPSQRANLRRAK